MPVQTAADVRNLISFDAETFAALHVLALDRSSSLQELADEAFRDLLAKHGRPVLLKEALKASARVVPANDQSKGKRPRRR